MTNMGSDVIKFYMGSDTSGQAGVTLPSECHQPDHAGARLPFL